MPSVRTTVQVVHVGPEENGRKLQSFLEARLGRLPSGLFMRLVRSGQVRIDGRRCKPFDRVTTGQKVRIPPVNAIPDKTPAIAAHELDIVHEDQDMLVVNKPRGLPVHAGTGWSDSVHDRLKASRPGFTPVPVHRLDRDTSGLLLCAKTHDFLRSMHQVWPLVSKAYLCHVQGRCTWPDWRTVISDLSKTGAAGQQRVTEGQGKTAVSHLHVLQARENHSLLLVVLGTGRTHQIRVQLAGIGHPIVGDPKYGQGQSLMLHATCLDWPGHHYFRPPTWPAPWAVEGETRNRIEHLLTTAPRKEGAI